MAINWQRMFRVYRGLAFSFDAYLRTVVFKQQIKGFNRLERAVLELEEDERNNPTKIKQRQ